MFYRVQLESHWYLKYDEIVMDQQNLNSTKITFNSAFYWYTMYVNIYLK